MENSILRPYHNCWRKQHIQKLAVLIDANNYYQALFDVLDQAQETIFIAAWELESKVGLSRVNPKFPADLRKYFNQLVQKHLQLQVAMVCWKPALYLGFSREFFAKLKWRRMTSSRIHFRQDRRQYMFSAFHEKIAVIDNSCAFLGGIDLSQKRWDNRKHTLDQKLRQDRDGKLYRPVHDLQVVLTGGPVKDLTHLFAKRMGKIPRFKYAPSGRKVWPRTHRPQIEDFQAALARTEPLERAFEIERFYLEAIHMARKFIFIENQYLTHEPIVDKLCQQLQQESAPEVIVILPYSYSGIWERSVFNQERNQQIQKLRLADKKNKLVLLYPSWENESYKSFILVHSKVLVVDGRFLSLGSANISHRSMRLDREVNLVVDAAGEIKVEKFCLNLVMQLLCEHLNVSVPEFETAYAEYGSLLACITLFQQRNLPRTLKPVPLVKLKFFERALFMLAPFVDMKWAWSKKNFQIISLCLLLIMVAIFGGLK